jgi:pimeloyl-ACP methyl ester carboxylesterase
MDCRRCVRVALGVAVAASLSIVERPSLAQAPAAPPAPEEILLETKDGVRLKATVFPGGRGKDTVPVIALHDFNGSRQDMFPLAQYLQATHGYTVIAPDLRGHGESTTTINPNKKLDATSMPITQFPLMVTMDCETVKKFLIERNNAGDLNIDKLAMVGAGMGSTVSILFAAQDWAWPILATGKQGQDVKAVAMISPEFVFKNLNMQAAMAEPGVQKSVSIYVLCGLLDSKAKSDAQRVFNSFSTHRKSEKDPKERSLFFEESLKTKLQGVKLLTEPALGVSRNIGLFLEVRCAKLPFPWANRPNPLG